jgi:hypothetical protein
MVQTGFLRKPSGLLGAQHARAPGSEATAAEMAKMEAASMLVSLSNTAAGATSSRTATPSFSSNISPSQQQMQMQSPKTVGDRHNMFMPIANAPTTIVHQVT